MTIPEALKASRYKAYMSGKWHVSSNLVQPTDSWPMQRGFDKGWDKLRAERLERLVRDGILDASWKLTDRDPTQPAWQDAQEHDWLLRCMEV